MLDLRPLIEAARRFVREDVDDNGQLFSNFPQGAEVSPGVLVGPDGKVRRKRKWWYNRGKK